MADCRRRNSEAESEPGAFESVECAFDEPVLDFFTLTPEMESGVARIHVDHCGSGLSFDDRRDVRLEYIPISTGDTKDGGCRVRGSRKIENRQVCKTLAEQSPS